MTMSLFISIMQQVLGLDLHQGGCRPIAKGQCGLGKQVSSQPLELGFSAVFHHHMHRCGMPKLYTEPGQSLPFPLLFKSKLSGAISKNGSYKA